MLKIDEMCIPNSTWNNAQEDEPVFVLRGVDKNTPEVILAWIGTSARDGISPEKLRGAFESYLNIVRWQDEHPELTHKPD